MPDDKPPPDSADLRQRAIARWDNEGGAASFGPQLASLPVDQRTVPDLSNSDLVQLRIRVIALENVIIALLAGASDQQLDLVREMAAWITPRAGSTQHPLTVQAATEMVHLIERSKPFR
jgi:hypothetical protein